MYRQVGLLVAFEAQQLDRERPADAAFADRRHDRSATDVDASGQGDIEVLQGHRHGTDDAARRVALTLRGRSGAAQVSLRVRSGVAQVWKAATERPSTATALKLATRACPGTSPRLCTERRVTSAHSVWPACTSACAG